MQRSSKTAFRLATLLLFAAGCDRPTLTNPGSTSLEYPLVLRTAADSAAALARHTHAIRASVQAAADATVPVFATEQVTVTVASASSSRCETVAVSGAVSQQLFAAVGGCGGGESDGVGQSATFTVPVDGSLSFSLSSSPASVSQVSGSRPTYTVALDDGLFDADFNDVVLTVTLSGAGPSLSCTPAIRGQSTTCKVEGTDVEVLGWEFFGDNYTNDPTEHHQEASTAHEWTGLAVLAGVVEAKIRQNGTESTLRTSLNVQERPWRWGQPQWSFAHAGAPQCDNTRPAVGVTFLVGWNTNPAGCRDRLQLHVQPDPSLKPRDGYTIDQVSGGPNGGLWYVTGATYRMDRASDLNPEFLPGGRLYRLRGAQEQQCRTAMGLGARDRVDVNFYTFNKLCQGVDVDAIIMAAWGHEEYGANGGAGHQGVAELEAGKLDNDPYAAVERQVAASDRTLRQSVNNAAYAAGSAISFQASDRSGRVAGNYPGGQVWLWDAGTGQYTLSPLRSF